MRFAIVTSMITALAVGPAHAEPNKQLYEGLPALPTLELGPEVLALGTSFEIVAGSLDINSSGQAGNSFDDESTTLAFSLSTRYFRGYEATSMGYSVVATGSDSLSRVPIGGGSFNVCCGRNSP